MANSSTERLHALDAVRGFALIAGIVFHATVSFLPTPGVPLWIVTDNHPSVTLAVVFQVLHTFRMTTFFLIAGFFAHLTFHRRGARGFIADRVKRIAAPLLVGWPLLFAAIVTVTIWAAVSSANGRPLPPPPRYPGFPSFPLTHLWFLYLLLWLYAATLVLRAIVVRLDRAGRVRGAVDRAVRVVAITNDMVRLSFLRALLADAGIAVTVLDGHTSAVEGSIGAIPRRLVVADADAAQARRVLAEAGES